MKTKIYCRLVLCLSLASGLGVSGYTAQQGVAQDGPSSPLTPAGSGAKGSAPARAALWPRSMFKLQIEALGERMKTPGKERSVLSGEFTDDRGNKFPVQISHQLPDLVAAVGMRPNGQQLKFDGTRPVLPLAKSEERFLESFSADSVEGLLDAERNGVAVRSLGFNFKSMTDTPDHPEPRFDIYQVTVTSKTRTEASKVTKMFWFDTATHLLMQTTYKDGETKIQTRFFDWGASEGSKYPSRVERYENGNQAFGFKATAVTAGQKVEESAFRP